MVYTSGIANEPFMEALALNMFGQLGPKHRRSLHLAMTDLMESDTPTLLARMKSVYMEGRMQP